jgi:hypothetical protein
MLSAVTTAGQTPALPDVSLKSAADVYRAQAEAAVAKLTPKQYTQLTAALKGFETAHEAQIQKNLAKPFYGHFNGELFYGFYVADDYAVATAAAAVANYRLSQQGYMPRGSASNGSSVRYEPLAKVMEKGEQGIRIFVNAFY